MARFSGSVLGIGFAALILIGSAPVATAAYQETGEELTLYDSEALLQTFKETGAKLADDSSFQDAEPKQEARSTSCSSYRTVTIASHMPKFWGTNYMSFPVCTQEDGGGDLALATVSSDTWETQGPMGWMQAIGNWLHTPVSKIPPVVLPLVFIVFALTFVFSIFASVLMKKAKPKEGTVEARYPEADAWKNGIVDWLWMGWATQWIARWGTVDNAAFTKIDSKEIPLSDPEDECDLSFTKFQKIWKEEVDRVGIANASLLKVVTRFVTYKKVFAIGAWNAAYDGFMILGPPIAIKWVTNYLNTLYTQRSLGVEVTSGQLIGPSILIIIVFLGLPTCMAISSAMCTMLNGRISIRIDGALSLAVYDKAQRLPVCQEDEGTLSITRLEKKAANTHKGKDTDGKEHTPEDEEFNSTPEDSSERLRASFGVPSRFNLVQLVTNDINTNLMCIPNCLARMVMMIPVLGATMCMLINEVGMGVLFFLAMSFLNLALMTSVGFLMRNSLMNYYTYSGTRLQFMQEVMTGIRFIKGCGAEQVVQQRLEASREAEMRSLDTYYTIQCFMFILSIQFPKLYHLASLGGYALFNGGVVEPAVIICLMPLLFSVQGAVATVFSLIPQLVMALPSCRRLEAFLKTPEAPRVTSALTNNLEPAWVTSLPEPEPGQACTDVGLSIKGDFGWSAKRAPNLKNIDITIPQGALVAVCGPVGCGKTTLVNAMMGELVPFGDSRISIKRRIAYSAQTPHLFEGNLKDNVLKGDDFDEERYKQTTFCAALDPDIAILPGGDQVPVGGRGITLSGGQKARISLARAAYDRADLVLLDDPFAAVDAHTGRHLNQHLLNGPLLQGRTRVVVCQPDSERISRFDWIIIVQDGRVTVQGRPQEIMQTREYNSLLCTTQEGDHIDDDDPTTLVATAGAPMIDAEDAFELREEECQGRASWNTIAWFGSMGGWVGILSCMVLYLAKKFLDLRTSIQLSAWMTHGSKYDAGLIFTKPNPWTYILNYIFWMLAATVCWFACWVGGQSWTMNVSKGCHNKMVASLLHAPVDRFYDKTPVGRIMNRMANDMMNVDMQVFVGCCSTIGMIWSQCVPLYYVHMQMPLWFTLLSIPFYYLVMTLISLYWKTMVPLRYLMQVSKSGVSSEVADVESTPSTVRAYRMEEERLRHFTLAVRKMIAADFVGRIICIRWLCNRLFVLGGFFAAGISLICVWMPSGLMVGTASLVINCMFSLITGVEGSIDTGSTAQYQIIAMNRIYEYTSLPEERDEELPQDKAFQNVAVTLRRSQLGELESRKTAEGVIQIYIRGMESDVILQQIPGTPHFVAAKGCSMGDLCPTSKELRECESWHRLVTVNSAHASAEDIAEELCFGASADVTLHVHSGWLIGGVKVEIKSLRVGYGDVPKDVLHGVSLTIPRRAKCGVCGPTGCGKSTLLLCLLRMLEPRDGRIYLESVDIANLGLRTLRKALGLVPQDPVLLQGSLRFNIDPFDLFDDNRIWEALRLVHLEDFVTGLKDMLNFQVSGEGGNLSFGQRQLLSLARNIVRKPMLLLLDEATSAIDPRTQELIQNTIEGAFQESTMVVIAHRLQTILDFDMVVVMDKGRVAEKGPLKEVAKVENGKFAKMLAAKGLSIRDDPMESDQFQFRSGQESYLQVIGELPCRL